MLVYRLEDRETHKGPFACSREWPKKGRHYVNVHSRMGCTVNMEFKYGWDSRNFRFGAKDLKQLEKYWGKQLKHFIEEGWVVGIYKVRKNYVHFSQPGYPDVEVAFNARKSKRIGEVAW